MQVCAILCRKEHCLSVKKNFTTCPFHTLESSAQWEQSCAYQGWNRSWLRSHWSREYWWDLTQSQFHNWSKVLALLHYYHKSLIGTTYKWILGRASSLDPRRVYRGRVRRSLIKSKKSWTSVTWWTKLEKKIRNCLKKAVFWPVYMACDHDGCHGNGNNDGPSIDIQKLPQRMKEQLLRVSAPQGKSSLRNFEKTLWCILHPLPPPPFPHFTSKG